MTDIYNDLTNASQFTPEEVLDLLRKNRDLKAENETFRAEVREWLCEECNTVYPGPPAHGFMAVVCPGCDGLTGPMRTIELRRARYEVARLQAENDRLKLWRGY